MYAARPGTLADHAALSEFTRDTFEWGDYVADAFPTWLDDPGIEVIVVEHETEGPVAVATLKRPGPHQAWLAAARVHPAHRRKGLASLMNDTGVAWATERGDRVARLVIEDWNEAPQRQVEALGYRRTSRWWFSTAAVADARVVASERLEPAAGLGPVDAWPVWARSGIARSARGLIPVHWTWWQLAAEDLDAFAADGLLWQAPSGWVVAEVEGDRLSVFWLCAVDADIPRLVEACVDLAAHSGLEQIAIFGPAHEPLGRPLRDLGFESNPLSIWEKPL